ncbi:MAG: 4Fe-4S dicluster domain-containing protein [Candidatus Aminicenantes bacterium]|nr:4Fe-4S dicluster domain-containing protein [Candidatus Aminicenantes bacterium]MBL7082365.1 4Fe-4S dicluster domain-containing protein [Candidatus Aminicenantes bacterium]
MATKKPAKKKPAKQTKAKATEKTATVFIMGKAHKVPADATIMGAIEYAGYQIKRGAGCREGFCGACATVYRLPGDYKIYTGLACTTLVEEGMWLSQLPAIPDQKPIYNLNKLEPNVSTFQKLFPELFRCVACNTCTKACPQDLEVMDYIQAAIRGDIEKVMDLSFDCLSCGLCAIRCPAEIVQYNVGLLAKRLYGKYLSKESKQLKKRIKEVKRHKYDKEYKEFKKMKKEELKKKYYERDLE